MSSAGWVFRSPGTKGGALRLKAALFLPRIGRGLLAAAALLVACLAAGPAWSARCDLKTLTIAVDIGHSPAEPGATGASGKREYAFNRRFAEEFVRQGERRTAIRFKLVEQGAEEMGLGQRARAAHRLAADLFLSFHHDSVNPRYLEEREVGGTRRTFSRHAGGHSLFVSSRNPQFQQSLALAKAIGRAFQADGLPASLHHAEKIPGENRDLLDSRLGIYYAPFAVLARNSVPAVLIELGVIVNPDEEADLERFDYRQRLISDVLDGIGNYCR